MIRLPQENFFSDTYVEEAIDLLRTHSNGEPYHVAFSGGKDSVVILDLIRRAGVPHYAQYAVTTFDPPELVRFIRENYPEVEFRKPKQRFEDMAARKGILPTRFVRYCCQQLKERKVPKGVITVTGIRAEESARRRITWRLVNEATTRREKIVNPIFEWDSEEIWNYIHVRGLTVCDLYSEGFHRLGCVGCPLIGKRLRQRDFARWPHIEARWKRIAYRIWNERVETGKTSLYKTPEDYWEWWSNC